MVPRLPFSFAPLLSMRPDRIIIDTPLEDAAKYKHVWLKAEGIALPESEVEHLLSTYDHIGAFSKQGIWAMRVTEAVHQDIKAKLGQSSLLTFLIKGLPTDYMDSQVAEFCSKLNWQVTVDVNSRRFRNHRLQWVVRASSPPPVFSTYCYTGSTRLRIDIEAAVRSLSPQRPPPVPVTAPSYAQVAARAKPSPSKPPPKRQRTQDEPSTPTRAPRRPFLASPPRRFPSGNDEQPSLEKRLARTEKQLLDMHHMLAQILTQLGAAPPELHHISSDREEDDSMPSPTIREALELSDATFSTLVDDARAS